MNKNVEVTSYLHFHPKVKIEVHKDRLILNDSILIDLDNFMEFKLKPYMYAEEFNKLEEGMKFVGKLYKYSRFVIKQL